MNTNKNYIDYGNEIPMAKKHLYVRNYNDVKDESVLVQYSVANKNNLFPKKLIESDDEYVTYLLKMVRDAIRNKPRSQESQDIADYIKGVTDVRDQLMILKDEDPQHIRSYIYLLNWRMYHGNVFYKRVNGYNTQRFIFEKNKKKNNKKAKANKIKESKTKLQLVKLDELVHYGSDYRKGKDVTTKQLGDEFSFYGIQYGNWVSEKERVHNVNLAYDALKDLKEALSLSYHDELTFNGILGLAFGARGSGKAAAHYEPTYKVINLTRFNGQGSLAHEWGHALDHYLGLTLGYSDMLSKTSAVRNTIQTFDVIMDILQYSDYHERSLECDTVENRKKNYWSSPSEMFARAFNCYVIDKLKEKGIRNDYLATEPIYTLNDKTFNPNPQGEERIELNMLFDELFEELSQKGIFVKNDYRIVTLSEVERKENNLKAKEFIENKFKGLAEGDYIPF